MRVTSFARMVSRVEGGRVNLTIAQIGEVLRVVNGLTRGLLYTAIRLMPEPR